MKYLWIYNYRTKNAYLLYLKFRFTKCKLEILWLTFYINWKNFRFHFCKPEFYGFHSVTGKISGLCHVNRKHSVFHFIRNHPGIPVFATNLRIIPFPTWFFSPSKMETLINNKIQFLILQKYWPPPTQKVSLSSVSHFIIILYIYVYNEYNKVYIVLYNVLILTKT